MSTDTDTDTAPARRRMTAKDREAITATMVAAYTNGETVRDIADAHGRSYGFVHRVLTDAGVEFRARGRVPGSGK